MYANTYTLEAPQVQLINEPPLFAIDEQDLHRDILITFRLGRGVAFGFLAFSCRLPRRVDIL